MSEVLENNANNVEQWSVFGGQLTTAEKSLLRNGILGNIDSLREVIYIIDSGEHIRNGLIVCKDECNHWYYGVVSWDENCRGYTNNGLELLSSR